MRQSGSSRQRFLRHIKGAAKNHCSREQNKKGIRLRSTIREPTRARSHSRATVGLTVGPHTPNYIWREAYGAICTEAPRGKSLRSSPRACPHAYDSPCPAVRAVAMPSQILPSPATPARFRQHFRTPFLEQRRSGATQFLGQHVSEAHSLGLHFPIFDAQVDGFHTIVHVNARGVGQLDMLALQGWGKLGSHAPCLGRQPYARALVF